MLKDHSLEVDYILRVNFDEKFEKIIGFSYEFRYDSSIYSSFFSYNYKYYLINKIDFLNVDYKIHNEMNFKICEKLNNNLEDTFFDDLDLMHDCRNDFFQKELKKSFCKEGFFDKNEDFINFILFKKYNLFKD